MYLFDDVVTTPEECRFLGELILKGIDLATERRGRAFTIEGGIVYADALTLAVIGRYGNSAMALDAIHNHDPDPYMVTFTIIKVLGIGEEIGKRVVRWHLVEYLSAKEITDKLLSAQFK